MKIDISSKVKVLRVLGDLIKYNRFLKFLILKYLFFLKKYFLENMEK